MHKILVEDTVIHITHIWFVFTYNKTMKFKVRFRRGDKSSIRLSKFDSGCIVVKDKNGGQGKGCPIPDQTCQVWLVLALTSAVGRRSIPVVNS